jgi:ketosteroid isomerase-like protein
MHKFVDAFNRRDLDSVAEDLDPAVELREWPEAPGARTYHGPEGVRQALDSWFESWEWMRVEVEDIVQTGDKVVVMVNQRAKGRGSAIELELRAGSVYTIRDGKVILLELFTSQAAALEAAGLR